MQNVNGRVQDRCDSTRIVFAGLQTQSCCYYLLSYYWASYPPPPCIYWNHGFSDSLRRKSRKQSAYTENIPE